MVQAVWDRLVPGLSGGPYDAPTSLPVLLAPRPLLLVQGAKDPRCPMDGLLPAYRAAKEAYAAAASESGSNGSNGSNGRSEREGESESESENGGAGGAADRVALFADPDAAHEMTPAMWTHIDTWFDRFL